MLKKIFIWLARLALGFLIFNAVGFAILYKGDIPVDVLKKKYASGNASAFMPVQGVQVHYRDQGDQQRDVPLVLLHGLSSSLLTWDSCVMFLKERTIRLDLPGFGLTGPNANSNYSIEYYVKFLHEFLEKLEVKQCYLAGSSLGGYIAWRYALAYPKEVKKLILIDAAGYPLKDIPAFGLRLGRMRMAKTLMTVINPKPVVKASLEDIYADDNKVTPHLIDQYCDMLLRSGNREALRTRLSAVQKFDTLAVKQVKVPTLIIWGSADKLIPRSYAAKFERDISESKTVVLSGVGHVPMEESPEETAARMEEFIQEEG